MARARLGMALQDLAGRIGDDQVLVRTRAGLAVRRMPRYRYPVPPALRASGERLRTVSVVWSDLSLPEVEAWRAWAATQKRRDPVTAKVYSPSAKNAFVGLGVKVLQVDPGAAVPRVPPGADYAGDGVRLVAAAEPGGVLFSADRPTGPGSVMELLTQRLVNARRSPTDRYVSAGFVRFEPGALEAFLPLAPGVYALAYRSVLASTGQMRPLSKLGVVEVG
ncbi:MAG: hypothetical protein KF884_09905 [Fimbriimonadaceae bacterium]|nr:hypothetical protein [Fimbriimonadaceae bacterium]QYK57860.1 MAG: hypothetical protein KF884_09905 [Fimbriimonadaceae bacterium]